MLGIVALLSVVPAPDDPLAGLPATAEPLAAAPGLEELDGGSPLPPPDAAPPAPEPPRHQPTQVPQAAPVPRTSAPRPAVTVLNNSATDGLAARAAARFRGAGWPVRLTGNFRGRLRATTVYYEPGQRAAAQRFARTFRGVPRVLPRPGFLPGPPGLTVVLTRHFPA